MIHVHFGVDVVNFHNEEVEVNSLDQHPTENGHQEILHQSCYCNTGSLWKERVTSGITAINRVSHNEDNGHLENKKSPKENNDQLLRIKRTIDNI